MFSQLLKALFGTEPPDDAQNSQDFLLAIAALLSNAAQADDHFSETERATIRRLLADGFALSPEDAARLAKSAEQIAEASVGFYRFIQTFVQNSEPDERIKLIEMLWEVVYADGVLTPDEDALIRRIAGLVYVSDFDRGEARKRVLKRLPSKVAS